MENENRETIQDFIEQIIKRYNLENDNQLAKKLKISREAVRQYKQGRTKFFDESTAYTIAELLKLNPAYVLLCRQVQRSKTKNIREIWTAQLAKIERYAAAVLVACFLLAYQDTAKASIVPILASFDITPYTLYEVVKKWLQSKIWVVRMAWLRRMGHIQKHIQGERQCLV